MAVYSPHWFMRNNLFKREAAEVPPGGDVFLGDSLTEKFDLQKYFPDRPVINRGINGDHIDGLLKRLDICALALKPSRIFIMIGINDIADGRSNAYILHLYAQIVEILSKEREALIYINSVLPTGPEVERCPPRQIIELNSELRGFTNAGQIYFVDLYHSFIKIPPWLDPALSVDGLHLNEAGYARWTDILKTVATF